MMRWGIFFLWTLQGFAAFHLTWGIPAISLDSNPPAGDSDVHPTVAIDPFGNAVAAWGRTAGMSATEDIWAASYHHASRVWTGALRVSGGGNASNASVAMDGKGNAILVWEEGFPTQIFYRTLSADGVWSPPLGTAPFSVVESAYAQTVPHIAMDPSGQPVVLWQEYYGGLTHIHSAKKLSDSSWTLFGALSDPSVNARLLCPKPMAFNMQGEGVAVWEEEDNGVHGAYYADGSWMVPFFVGLGKEPSVGIDEEGSGMIVWNQDGLIQSKSFTRGALSDFFMNVSDFHFAAQRPCVGLDEKGNAVVVFERFDAGFMHKFVSGATWIAGDSNWSLPVDISAPSPAGVAGTGFPLLSINAIGDGVVIWKEFNGEKTVIQGAGYSLGTWSFIRTLSSKSDQAGRLSPHCDMGIALNLAGNIIAVWPEDPSGMNTPHIKSVPGTGLAIAGPMPPLVDEKSLFLGVGKGYQISHRFPAHTDLINILDWTSPGGVAYFNVYRGNLSSLIGTSSTPHYEDHQRERGKKVTYLITSVDVHGHESGPMTIVVN